MDRVRAIIDGEYVYGWYVYACRTSIANQTCWNHEIHISHSHGVTEIFGFDPATAAVATGKKDKSGAEIYGSKGIFGGGDMFIVEGGAKWTVWYNAVFCQWITTPDTELLPMCGLGQWPSSCIEIIKEKDGQGDEQGHAR